MSYSGNLNFGANFQNRILITSINIINTLIMSKLNSWYCIRISFGKLSTRCIAG